MKFRRLTTVVLSLVCAAGCAQRSLSVADSEALGGGDPFLAGSTASGSATPSQNPWSAPQPGMSSTGSAHVKASPPQQGWAQAGTYQTHPEFQAQQEGVRFRMNAQSEKPEIQTVANVDDPFAAPTVTTSKVVHADFKVGEEPKENPFAIEQTAHEAPSKATPAVLEQPVFVEAEETPAPVMKDGPADEWQAQELPKVIPASAEEFAPIEKAASQTNKTAPKTIDNVPVWWD